MGGFSENSLTTLAIFLLLAFAQCEGSQLTEPADSTDSTLINSESLAQFQRRVDTLFDYPKRVVEQMTALENYELEPVIDDKLLSVWKRIRWDESEEFQDFFSNGSANSNYGTFDYTTFRYENTNWLISISREPMLGRSIQAYYIEGDSLYLKFLNPDAKWEVWYRPQIP